MEYYNKIKFDSINVFPLSHCEAAPLLIMLCKCIRTEETAGVCVVPFLSVGCEHQQSWAVFAMVYVVSNQYDVMMAMLVCLYCHLPPTTPPHTHTFKTVT